MQSDEGVADWTRKIVGRPCHFSQKYSTSITRMFADTTSVNTAFALSMDAHQRLKQHRL